MPIPSQNPNDTTGLGAMAKVLEGYMVGEEIKRARFVEEREYEFEREQFDESTRRFDTSFEEGVRQFDESLVFQSEQAALLREHQVELQDDLQEFQSEEADLERTSREQDQAANRAQRYWERNEINKQQEADRALQAEDSKFARYEGTLGGHKSYDEIPDQLIQGASGAVYSNWEPGFLQNEIRKVASGEVSDALPKLTQEQAAQALEGLETNELTMEMVLAQFDGAGQITWVPNTGKQAAIENLAMAEAGGRSGWDRLDGDEQQEVIDGVIYDLNHLDGMKKKWTAEKRANQVFEAGLENGSARPSARSLLSESYGNYFYNKDGMVVTSNKAGADIRHEAEYMTWETVNYITDIETMTDPKAIAARTEEWAVDLRKRRDAMAAHMERDGEGTEQADLFYEWAKNMGEDNDQDMSIWDANVVRKKPSGPSKGYVDTEKMSTKVSPGGVAKKGGKDVVLTGKGDWVGADTKEGKLYTDWSEAKDELGVAEDVLRLAKEGQAKLEKLHKDLETRFEIGIGDKPAPIEYYGDPLSIDEFGYGGPSTMVKPARKVTPEVYEAEQALQKAKEKFKPLNKDVEKLEGN